MRERGTGLRERPGTGSIRRFGVSLCAVFRLAAVLLAACAGAQAQPVPASQGPARLVSVIVVLKDQFAGEVLSEEESRVVFVRESLNFRLVSSRSSEIVDNFGGRSALVEKLDALTEQVRRRAAEALAVRHMPSQRQVSDLILGLGGEVSRSFHSVNALHARLPADRLALLRADPLVAEVMEDARRRPMLDVSVPELGARSYWDAGIRGEGQRVAVLDSGVDRGHPALATVNWAVNRAFLSAAACSASDSDTDAGDFFGHGTHVAGIVMSRGTMPEDEKRGVARGLTYGYNYKIACIRPDGDVSSHDSDVLAALDHLVSNTSAKIVNYSYGAEILSGDDPAARMWDYFADTYGLVPVFAAGNVDKGQTTCAVNSPGTSANGLTVGNWSARGTMNSTSCRGPSGGSPKKPDLAAPGTNISSTNYRWADAGIFFVDKTGTSMAAPHIAGAAALLAQSGVSMPLCAKAVLINTTDDSGWMPDRGWGYSNLQRARNHPYCFDGLFTFAGGIEPAENYYFKAAVSGLSKATLVWPLHFSRDGSGFSFRSYSQLSLRAYRLDNTPLETSVGSTSDNINKLETAYSGTAVLTVRANSVPTGLASERFALATTLPVTRTTGPQVTASCSGPASIEAGQSLSLACTFTNRGDLAAYSVTGRHDSPQGFGEHPEQWIGTIEGGASASYTWQIAVAAYLSGSYSLNVLFSNQSYGHYAWSKTTFTVRVLPRPGAVALLSPANGAAGQPETVTLAWTAVTGAVSYSVYIGTSNPPADATTAMTNSLGKSGLACGSTYYWYVVAGGFSGTPHSISNTWSFTTAACPPAPGGFALLAPANGAEGQPANPALSWSASAGAAYYDVYLGTEVNPAFAFRTTSTSFVPAAPGAGVTYYWRVVAGVAGATTASPVWTFRTSTNPATLPLRFVPVTPCRLADTRGAAGEFGGPRMLAGYGRGYPVARGPCGIPPTAHAYSLNVTVVPSGPLAYLTLWPAGEPLPYVSTLNSQGGDVVANAAIVPAGAGGAINVYVTDETEVILDINGYFQLDTGSTFYAATPCRVADTRNGAGPFGGPILAGGTTRSFVVPGSACAPPASATAYAMNATVVPPNPLGYLTTWPAGGPRPVVSTLNSYRGRVVANAAVIPAGSGGAISAYVTDATHLILDINGYFGAAGGIGALSYYRTAPCRVVDTRLGNGAFGGPILAGGGSRTFPVPQSSCAIPATAKAYSVNITVVPAGALDYLTVWPAGQAMPVVSTLNSYHGAVVANAAIVPAGTNGGLSFFATQNTHLIVDINGYFH